MVLVPFRRPSCLSWSEDRRSVLTYVSGCAAEGSSVTTGSVAAAAPAASSSPASATSAARVPFSGTGEVEAPATATVVAALDVRLGGADALDFSAAARPTSLGVWLSSATEETRSAGRRGSGLLHSRRHTLAFVLTAGTSDEDRINMSR